jgi:hypothetical protein
MKNSFLTGGVLLWTSIVLTASAPQPLNVKTGLWQVSLTSMIKGLPVPNTNTYRSCVKKEDLDKYPFADPDMKCSWTVQNSTGSKMDASGTCMPAGQGKVDFKMQLEALDSENVKGTGQLTMNGPGGAIDGTYAATAKWIGASCPAGEK